MTTDTAERVGISSITEAQGATATEKTTRRPRYSRKTKEGTALDRLLEPQGGVTYTAKQLGISAIKTEEAKKTKEIIAMDEILEQKDRFRFTAKQLGASARMVKDSIVLNKILEPKGMITYTAKQVGLSARTIRDSIEWEKILSPENIIYFTAKQLGILAKTVKNAQVLEKVMKSKEMIKYTAKQLGLSVKSLETVLVDSKNYITDKVKAIGLANVKRRNPNNYLSNLKELSESDFISLKRKEGDLLILNADEAKFILSKQ